MCYFTTTFAPDANRVQLHEHTLHSIIVCQNLIRTHPGEETQSPILRGHLNPLNPFNLTQVKVLKVVQVYSSTSWNRVLLAVKDKL